jgi:hypothetical protein
MDALCKFSKTAGVPCGLPAPHKWGPLDLCCGHFDELVTAMFEIKGTLEDRQHEDFMKIYEDRTNKSSLAEGSTCEEKWTPRIHVIDEKKKPGDP